ncbi:MULTISPECIES: LysR family transcriptional regulator [Paenibacillus]|uniref:LysR family transcriptional regulator n=1 Tax=Paenibacillus campinasensis TaxID=66347 RepID=A0A268EXX1_9BACL|nr:MULTISPECIES: LysR family transcriptional regulator [Paenibacillus]MUG66500.1 LysR family transcriptional regulator [Paenibacillus campinasensis]PAD77969.1 LysR family transcriptional regulator [Paenibacillus campinasensis]PAK52951.1 LysR family transcriptional regulator [Paenibacillus sp. 7541]
MFEELDVFAVVVEQSSINKASKLLNLSQPAVSRKIAKLEDELGLQLFNRRGKRLELTSIGQIVYTFALEQRQQQLKFMQTLAHYREGEQISITLGASLTTLQTTLPPLVNAFMEKHPAAEIKLVTGKTHEIVSYVRERRVDIGIVASSINQPGLKCIPLFDDHLELVIPLGHPLAELEAVSIEHLQGLPMIIFSTGTWYRKLTDDLFHRWGIMPDIRMEIDSFEAIVRLIPTCKAAALLPKSYLRPQLLSDNGLLDIHIPALIETRRTTSLVYDESSDLSSAARRWIAETEVLFTELRKLKA